MIVSIHQPHYFLSFAQIKKIVASDRYVFFDDVQIPQGKSVVHRAKIKYENDFKWINISKSKSNNSELICDINKLSNDYIIEHSSIIKNYYKKTPSRDWIIKLLEKTEKYQTICDIDIFITKEILNYLEFEDIKFFRSSELCQNKTYENTIDKIIDINKQLDATVYLTGDGPGSMRYMDEEEFKKENIEVKYFSFMHPIYKQSGVDFIKDLSIIDLICNEGKENAKNILLSC
ncbi:WbqC family protein [Aliarcobacter cryaerophilus]|uniref:WbqC family protein n=1 Tax=Aliarcobacter cryaerophilus TaxID=28198 RepID=UPI0021B649B1|nr:WbqC family protein [Aliarcobacter cryaerophilus]MCT7492509.1 WbqC family protein [Aliarcobacter cryaerophilus]